MMVIISGFICVMLLAIAFWFIILPIQIPAKGIRYWWIAFIIGLAIFARYSEPAVSDDLYRHYENVDALRYQDEEIFQSPMLVWRFICWLVSLTSSNGWLPFIAILVYGFGIGRILFEYIKKNEYKTKIIFTYAVSLLGSCSIFYLISGIRNVIAVVIWAYAYYFFYKKHKIKYYILCFLALGIHLLPIVLMILLIIYERFIFNEDKENIVRTFFIALFLNLTIRTAIIPSILKMIPVSYSQFMAEKWIAYVDRGFFDTVVIESKIKLGYLIIVLAIGIAHSFQNNKKHINFFTFVVISTLALSPMIMLFERIPYFIGISLLPTLNEWYITSQNRAKSLMIFAIAGYFIFQSAFAVHQMFATIRFGGYYFHTYF